MCEMSSWWVRLWCLYMP